MNKKMPQIKRDIGVFLSSEEAKITKKNLAKLGLEAVSIFLILQTMQDAFADHNSYIENPNKRGQHHSVHTSGHSNCAIHASGW